MNKIKILLLSLLVIMISCTNSDEQVIETTTSISASDFSTTINENPATNQSLGTIDATTNQGEISFSIIEQFPNEAFEINSTTGELTVLNSSLFDFEINPSINGTVKLENGGVFDTINISITLNDINELTLQERLDNGETPYQIYQSNNSLLDSLYGLTYQGGIIFYLDTANGNGIVAAPFDQSNGIKWGCMGTNVPNAEHSSIGYGNSNTNAIVAMCNQTTYAAKLCHDLNLNGYSDWFLPSKDELNLIYTNLHLNGFGNFENGENNCCNGWYWSSTEFEDQSTFNDFGYEAAWVQSFRNGHNGLQVTYDIGIKDLENQVRAVRYF